MHHHGDLLRLDADLAQRLDRMRWTMRTDPLVYGLIGHLVDDLGGPEEILTSLDRLADATGQDADDVRLALAKLVRSARGAGHGGSARHLSPRLIVFRADRVP
ncbi:DUF6042 family protein [Streptomyces griseoaurantiacus]|uniref:Uncharacterized protein n=1 Tax=Streptomyces griseoaurantiacus M045 TaxID=996637 RepID=F3NBV3_9ACTN|nr:DUF6042 family protein [Streptomyces griseoaurantiacus]EGG49061.1 hypothetical protein SGM_6642 [Streptomyces griseoaurantiacus M045]